MGCRCSPPPCCMHLEFWLDGEARYPDLLLCLLLPAWQLDDAHAVMHSIQDQPCC